MSHPDADDRSQGAGPFRCTPPLRWREMEIRDCGPAVEFLESVNHGRQDIDQMSEAWLTLLRRGSLKAALVEDARKRMVSLGASVFVKDAFVAELQLSDQPFVAARIMCASLSRSSPVLTSTDVAIANAGEGLNVFIVRSGIAEVALADSDVKSMIKAELMKGFMELHVGYNVQRVLAEALSVEERSMYLDGGAFRLINGYSRPHENCTDPASSMGYRPFLVGLSRREVREMEMHPLLPLFSHHAKPRCSFSASERLLLSKALVGHTDQELALALDLSLYTVKKRWVGILSRVERHIPECMVGTVERNVPGIRGAQKRHRLLRYVRAHPEELTPYRSGVRPRCSG